MEQNSLFITQLKYWENFRKYLNLMREFVDEHISGTEFHDEFLKMWKADRDRTYSMEELFYIISNFKVENFQLTELDRFLSLIDDVFSNCEFFEADPLVREDSQISEEELRNRVRETLFEIQIFFPYREDFEEEWEDFEEEW